MSICELNHGQKCRPMMDEGLIRREVILLRFIMLQKAKQSSSSCGLLDPMTYLPFKRKTQI